MDPRALSPFPPGGPQGATSMNVAPLPGGPGGPGPGGPGPGGPGPGGPGPGGPPPGAFPPRPAALQMAPMQFPRLNRAASQSKTE